MVPGPTMGVGTDVVGMSGPYGRGAAGGDHIVATPGGTPCVDTPGLIHTDSAVL